MHLGPSLSPQFGAKAVIDYDPFVNFEKDDWNRAARTAFDEFVKENEKCINSLKLSGNDSDNQLILNAQISGELADEPNGYITFSMQAGKNGVKKSESFNMGYISKWMAEFVNKYKLSQTLLDTRGGRGYNPEAIKTVITVERVKNSIKEKLVEWLTTLAHNTNNYGPSSAKK